MCERPYSISNVQETILSNVRETILSNVRETILSNVRETILSNVRETILEAGDSTFRRRDSTVERASAEADSTVEARRLHGRRAGSIPQSKEAGDSQKTQLTNMRVVTTTVVPRGGRQP
ncbi:hypothetical protein AVEN_146077-1 [Araneus ventricosus]|uniref:Uncharacterized protein n=1 Tax=Araneus ventricosus TaxID=182803 RepID=A0A4Y2U8Y7_ARAVE|nr:hypothetical protein AVEN_146077-1 [Araneus ventricosus]